MGAALFTLILLLATVPSFILLLVAFLFLEKFLQRLVLVPKTSELHAGSSCSAGTLREFGRDEDECQKCEECHLRVLFGLFLLFQAGLDFKIPRGCLNFEICHYFFFFPETINISTL